MKLFDPYKFDYTILKSYIMNTKNAISAATQKIAGTDKKTSISKSSDQEKEKDQGKTAIKKSPAKK